VDTSSSTKWCCGCLAGCLCNILDKTVGYHLRVYPGTKVLQLRALQFEDSKARQGEARKAGHVVTYLLNAWVRVPTPQQGPCCLEYCQAGDQAIQPSQASLLVDPLPISWVMMMRGRRSCLPA
jgi:hypothetical protein